MVQNVHRPTYNITSSFQSCQKLSSIQNHKFSFSSQNNMKTNAMRSLLTLMIFCLTLPNKVNSEEIFSTLEKYHNQSFNRFLRSIQHWYTQDTETISSSNENNITLPDEKASDATNIIVSNQISGTNTCEKEGDSCDDGIFCNGEEICDSSLRCVSINPPCSKCYQICDEHYGQCLETVPTCASRDSFTYAIWNKDTCSCEFKSKTIKSFFRDLIWSIILIFQRFQ